MGAKMSHFSPLPATIFSMAVVETADSVAKPGATVADFWEALQPPKANASGMQLSVTNSGVTIKINPAEAFSYIKLPKAQACNVCDLHKRGFMEDGDGILYAHLSLAEATATAIKAIAANGNKHRGLIRSLQLSIAPTTPAPARPKYRQTA